jgi:hypothetical protein
MIHDRRMGSRLVHRVPELTWLSTRGGRSTTARAVATRVSGQQEFPSTASCCGHLRSPLATRLHCR